MSESTSADVIRLAFGNMNTSNELWGEDSGVFNPNRFLVSEEERSKLVGQMHTFGGGARHCM